MSDPFTKTVPGLGTFQFRKRTMRDQIAIEAEALRILGGPIDDKELEHIAQAMATVKLLTTHKPEGWDVEKIDPLDNEASKQLWAVYGVLRAAEEEFRAKAKA